jgi:hypothetical protein
MGFIVTMGNSFPATTKAVFGNVDFKSFYLDLNEATTQQKAICSDFLNIVGGHFSINIINSNYNFDDCNYVLENGIDEEITEVDYSQLTTQDQNKINLFANLLKSLAQ